MACATKTANVHEVGFDAQSIRPPVFSPPGLQKREIRDGAFKTIAKQATEEPGLGVGAGLLPAGAVVVCVAVTITWGGVGGVGEAVGSDALVEALPGQPWGEQKREKGKQ